MTTGMSGFGLLRRRPWGGIVAVALGVFFLPVKAGEPTMAAAHHRVVFAQDTLANDWRRAQAIELEREFGRHPRVSFRYTDAQGSAAHQIQDIEEALARGVDLLIVSARDAELTARVVEKARAAGVRVMLLSRRVSTDAYDVFIHADNADIGRRAARRLVQRLKGKGRILVLQGVPTASTAIERTEGFLDEIARSPGIQVVAVKPADYLRDKAVAAIEEARAEGLRFDAIYAQSDSMAAGARIALRRAGIDPRGIPIVGIDYIAEAREAIRKGEQDASFVYPTFAREGVAAALKLLAGRRVPREIVVPTVMVTRDNVERVEPIF